MEEKQAGLTRKFRGKAAILKLLQEQTESGQTIKSFCETHGIANGTFHNWRNRFSSTSVSKSVGFAALHVAGDPGLFAVVGNVRIYQPVSAAYLKELQA